MWHLSFPTHNWKSQSHVEELMHTNMFQCLNKTYAEDTLPVNNSPLLLLVADSKFNFTPPLLMLEVVISNFSI